MTVAYLDSLQTLYVVQGRAKPVLSGPNSRKPNLFHHEKPHAGLDDFLNMLLSGFRKRMSEVDRLHEGVLRHSSERGA